MDLFLALLPALFWGSIVLFNVKLGGGPYSQTLGTTIGALIVSIVIYLFVQPALSMRIFIVGIVSGLFWSLGQSNQLKSIQLMGVSKTMPISTGMQLVSTSCSVSSYSESGQHRFRLHLESSLLSLLLSVSFSRH